MSKGLSWEVLRNLRAWVRCRVQARVLTAGKRKRAKCLFCEWVGSWLQGYPHVFGSCPAFSTERQAVVSAADPGWLEEREDPQAWWAVLRAEPGMGHFVAALAFAAEVERRAAEGS